MNYVILLSAGQGTRFGGPKQFVDVLGKPLFMYSLETLAKSSEISGIVVVCNKEHIDKVKEWILEFGVNKVLKVIAGGKSRNESVHNGLDYLTKLPSISDSDIVLIHDSARPLVSTKLIESLLEPFPEYDASAPILEMSDSVVEIDEDTKYIDRSKLYKVQTPQCIKLDVIKDSHATYDDLATDDIQLVLKKGYQVKWVKGETTNIKVTTFDDLKVLESYLS